MAPLSLSSLAEARGEAIDPSVDRDVAKKSNAWIATSDEPWLQLEMDANVVTGRCIGIVSESGLTDPLTQPLPHCVTPDGEINQILPGGVLGRAIRIGGIPP